MPRRLPVLVVLSLLAAAPAWAGYAEGVAAFGAGRHEQAAREFQGAAAQGDVESAYMLGRLYAMGSGVPQDWVQAWIWYDRAARGGNELAAAARENMESVMTPEQLTVARTESGSPTAIAERPPSVQPYDTGAYNPVNPAPGRPPDPIGAADRQTVLIPRESVVASVQSPPPDLNLPPAPLAAPQDRVTLRANGATDEGMLLARGELRQHIRAVQRRLNQEGYWAGPVDGIIGPLTRQAVRSWQRDQGLRPTGRITWGMIERLNIAPQTAQAGP